jgi:MinD superfamily P-loop ATPase
MQMRRFIFILMIALLPLRGWMGEAMATEMAAITIVAAQANNTPATAEFSSKITKSDCEMHAGMQKVNSESKSKPSCSHCQACHAMGLINTVEINSVSSAYLAQPTAFNSPFVSANLALSQKPPIL